MTTTTTAPPRRTSRSTALIIGAAVILVVLLVLLVASAAGRGKESTSPGHPLNPGPEGTQAMAQVLDDKGVDVDIVEGLGRFLDAPRPESDTTVVLAGAPRLRGEAATAFRERVADAARVILIDPLPTTVTEIGMAPLISVDTPWTTMAVSAECDAAGISPGDQTIVPSTTDNYSVRSFASFDPTAIACFTVDGGSQVLVIPAKSGSEAAPEIVVMAPTMLENSEITSADNAGVALRVFGSTDRLLWYLPQTTDGLTTGGGAEEPSDIPRALWPLMLLSFFALVALMFWRGRRFGPVITEPLPVVVKAIETTESRGRLYHRARAADRAAAQLRLHTLSRLAASLGLPFDASPSLRTGPESPTGPDDPMFGRPDPVTGLASESVPGAIAIADAVSTTTGRPPADVHALLIGPLPTDDAALVDYAHDLTVLEKEVRRTP